MTKYILNSGAVSNYPYKATKFFQKLTKGLGSNPKILLCYFAQPSEEWEDKFAEDSVKYKDFFEDGIHPKFEMAFPDSFEKQLQNSDALYIRGGDDHLIMYWLKQFDVSKIWEGKTVATSSASSHALSKHFWTCDWRKCIDGFGGASH